jgi:molybdenum cofactor guanylyltransferase
MRAGLVLAGGRSRRFGTEKALVAWDGAPLIAHACRPLAGCAAVAVNARPDSGAATWAAARGLPLLPDPDGAPDGPLSGVREGLRWATGLGADLLAVVPCDSPRLPDDLFDRLRAALTPDTHAAMAFTDEGPQPLAALWRTAPALDRVEAALADGAHPSVQSVLADLSVVRVHFADASAFVNVNTPDGLAELGRKQP